MKKKTEKGYYISLKPKKVDQSVWEIVIDCWRNGLSDREAAFRASEHTTVRITADEIKQWKKDDPDIAELCEMLKDDLKAIAKTNMAEFLRDKRAKSTMWYLEHKCPEEFSTKSAVAFEGQVIGLSLAEKDEAYRKLVEDFESNGE